MLHVKKCLAGCYVLAVAYIFALSLGYPLPIMDLDGAFFVLVGLALAATYEDVERNWK